MAGSLIEHPGMAGAVDASEHNPGLPTRSRGPGDSTRPGVDGDRLCIELLEPNTALDVQTVNSLYRIEILDGERHVVTIRGGTSFPEGALVRFEGATGRDSAPEPGWIVVGRRMEIWLGAVRIRTSRVRSVSISNH
jgi:hypothetical protein